MACRPTSGPSLQTLTLLTIEWFYDNGTMVFDVMSSQRVSMNLNGILVEGFCFSSLLYNLNPWHLASHGEHDVIRCHCDVTSEQHCSIHALYK